MGGGSYKRVYRSTAYKSRLTNGLRDDHDYIVIGLTVLKRGLALLERGTAAIGVVDKALSFLARFADQCHHGKEELILFPLLERRGMQFERSPLKELVSEHGMGRYFLRNARRAAERYGSGEGEALGDLEHYFESYFNLIIGHIGKENKVLFKMADNYIGPDEGVAEAEKIEEQLGYAELLAELEAIKRELTQIGQS